jgi:hypothetical protein
LERVTIRGGSVGVLSQEGDVYLEDVRLAGQSQAGLLLARGEAKATRLEVRGGGAETRGVWVQHDAQAELALARIEGTFRRGVQVNEGGQLVLEDSSVDVGETAVHASHATLRFERVELRSRRGPVLFLAGGSARLAQVKVSEGEYGILVRDLGRVDAEDLTVMRSARAGVALVRSQLRAQRFNVSASGNLGAVQSVEGEVALENFQVSDAVAYGVIAVGGKLRLTEGSVSAVQVDSSGDAGEALHLSRARADIRNFHVRNAWGPCVLVLEGARARMEGLVLESCGGPALQVTTHAQVDARNGRVDGATGPAVALGDGALLALDSWSLRRIDAPPLTVDCDGTTRLFLGRLTPAEARPSERCVRPLREVPPGLGR